jgi:hypothetical protein
MARRRAAARTAVRLGSALLALWLAAGCGPEPRPLPPPSPPPDAAHPVPTPECRRIVRIEVDKSERRLRAHCERGGLVVLTAALGRRRDGAKRAAGDQRTPEGHYRISGPPRASRFHLFVPIDYPSVADADRALEEGRIGRDDHRRIVGAHARGETPPDNTALGGAIGFHGEGRRWRGDTQHFDWTYGCVGLSDADIEFLAAAAEVGTPVVVSP